MSVFRTYANAIADDLVTTHGYDAAQVKASPFIDIIVQILTQLLPLLLSCIPKPPTPHAVQERCQNLGLFDRIFIRRAAKENLGSDGFDWVGQPLIISTMKSLATITPEHCAAAIAEVGG